MMEVSHPGRSAEFLSRRHDGELTDAERAAFDLHRESCPSCTAAAEEFERSLSLYRAAPTDPPASDLSARILRKIRAQSPARRPFGVTFGIDIRWAGALLAALLVVILGAPLLLRRESPQPAAAPAGAIPAHLLDRPSPQSELASQTGTLSPESNAGREDAQAPRREKREAPATKKRDALAVPQAPPAPAPAADEPAGIAAAPKRESKDVAEVLVRRQRAAAARAGGESEAGSAAEASPARLTVSSIDGQGTAPSVASQPPEDRLAALRGREFVLLVESNGRVREVHPAFPTPLAAQRKALGADAEKTADGSEVLRELRFRPGDRPRRLLARIE